MLKDLISLTPFWVWCETVSFIANREEKATQEWRGCVVVKHMFITLTKWWRCGFPHGQVLCWRCCGEDASCFHPACKNDTWTVAEGSWLWWMFASTACFLGLQKMGFSPLSADVSTVSVVVAVPVDREKHREETENCISCGLSWTKAL